MLPFYISQFQEHFKQATILAENLLAMKIEDRLQTLGLNTPKVKSPAKLKSRTKPKHQNSSQKLECSDSFFYLTSISSSVKANDLSNKQSSTGN